MRITTIEDGFEYRVKEIFKQLRETYDEVEANEEFEKWVWENRVLVGQLFLEDVEVYMGWPK